MDKTMETIRAIRDKNSVRHMSMTSEERREEGRKSLEFLEKQTGKPVKVANKVDLIDKTFKVS